MKIRKESNMLENEFRYYLDNQNEFVKKYNGRVLVIIGENIVGDYVSSEEAYIDSKNKYELGTFLIQKCTPGTEAYTKTFYSPRVIFA
jgi:hypothetical protein